MYKIDNLDISNVINHMISITDLARGKAAKVLNSVVKEKVPYIILKNNKPLAALVDIDIYNELVDKSKKYSESLENLELLEIAEKRMENFDQAKTYTHAEALKKLNLTEEDLAVVRNEVELDFD
jgi:prevent-host-death family protein